MLNQLNENRLKIKMIKFGMEVECVVERVLSSLISSEIKSKTKKVIQ